MLIGARLLSLAPVEDFTLQRHYTDNESRMGEMFSLKLSREFGDRRAVCFRFEKLVVMLRSDIPGPLMLFGFGVSWRAHLRKPGEVLA